MYLKGMSPFPFLLLVFREQLKKIMFEENVNTSPWFNILRDEKDIELY